MALTIDNLEIQIQSDSKNATSGIDALTSSLEKLKSVVGDTSGLASNLTQISTALKTFSGLGKIDLASPIKQLSKLNDLIPTLGGGQGTQLAQNLRDIADGLMAFSPMPKVSVTPVANGMKALNDAILFLDDTKLARFSEQMREIAAGLSNLSTVGKSNIGSIVGAVKKIPKITESLDTDTIARFSVTIRQLTDIMTPLGTEMDKIARGFNALPKYIQRAIKATEKSATATKKANEAHGGTLFTLSQYVNQYRRLYQVIDRVVDVCADLFNESNEYIEALNLFKVSMGEASDAALEYSETVSAAMGIDPAEWISNQGTFQRMATGFGIVSDEAEIMSQNLTQLAYDLSSFFNTDVKTAMEKLQSGMSGQIKGLKAWGYNLSVAALQETALNLGIEESVRNMTEAQKAQLRYITLIQKSNGIMGDMAKTINTPANAMRVLDAQITQLKRSLGNIVSLIATKVIPYIQAFVEVMAEGARALAEAWGFEIKDLPTNNLEMASDVIDGIGEDVDNTTDAVSKLKKQLMGFDELNILGNSKDEEDTKGTSNSLNIKLPEYDFLSNLDNKTRERIDEIKQAIKDVLPVLEGLAKAIAIAFAVTSIIEAKNAIKLFFNEAKLGIGIAQLFNLSFGDFFKLAKQNGVFKTLGTSIKTLGKNFKSAMSSLSPFTKALVSIVALGLEFSVVKDAVYDLTKGNKSLGESLLAIIPICTAVGVAMYAMLGPWGLVAAAVVGVVAALSGFVEAENEMRKQLSHESFYDDYGKTVSKLAGEFDGLMTSATKAYDSIIEKQDDVVSAKGNIQNMADEVATLVFQVESGATKIVDAIPTIVEAFKTLYNDTRTYLEDTANLIYAALAGNVGQALKDIGMDIGVVAQATGKVTEEALTAIESLNAANEKLAQNHAAGLITDDEYYSKLTENILAIQKWSGVQSDGTKEIEEAKKSVGKIFSEGINWDSDNLQGDLQGFVTAADNAKETIKSAYGAIISALEQEKQNAELLGDTESAAIFGDAIANINVVMEGEISSIDGMLSEAVGFMQTDLINEMEKVYSEAVTEWDNLDWWTKEIVYSGNIDDYISARLADYQEIVQPIIEELKDVFGEESIYVEDIIASVGKSMMVGDNGFENSLWFNSEIKESFTSMPEEIEKAMFSNGQTLITALKSGFSADDYSFIYDAATDSIKILKAGVEFAVVEHTPELEEQLKGLGVNLSDGLIEGAEAGMESNKTKWYEWAIWPWNWFKKKNEINSPSKLFERGGEYIIQGLWNGLEGMWNSLKSWWENLSLPSIDLKMPHFEWTTQPAEGWAAKALEAIGLPASLPKLNVEWYASGGFPSIGQMFIARERGPELVGRIGNKNAVANNDQITAGIASAVYSAMMAAQEDGNNGGGNARIIVQIGEQAVGEASVRYINGQIVQTGASPIYS